MAETLPPLHPESQAVIDFLMSLNMKPYPEMGSMEEARDRSRRVFMAVELAGEVQYDGTRKELFVPLPDFTGTIPVYVYTPNNLVKDPPILVYFHGGGMVIGCRGNVETTCQIISAGAGCIVVNVEYRLAPEHRFPTPIDDGCTVTRWVLKHKNVVGGTEKSKVGVSGDSGGGTMTASVAHDVPGLSFQIPIYPHIVAAGDKSLQSYKDYKDGPFVYADLIDWFEHQLLYAKDYKNPRLAAVLRPRFDHLPPTLLIVAEVDIVRDDSYEYEKKLKAAGVHCELHLAKGALHGFCTMPGTFKELCGAAHAKMIDFIKKWGL